MAGNNNNPAWYPPVEPSDSQQTTNWKRLVMQYVFSLRDQQSNLNQTVENFNNNVTEQIAKITNQIAAGNNPNNSTSNPLVIYGSYLLMRSYSPNLYTGYIFVQTDRNQAMYYSNGGAWVLIEGSGSGSFENRWSNLNTYDSGLFWVETSRNNFNGVPPYPTYQWDGANWSYRSGELNRNQNNLATLISTFGTNNSNDNGVIVNVIDFTGQLKWNANSNSFNWGPADSRMHGMGPIFAEVDPDPTQGWALYDGNNYTYLLSSGGMANITLPNLVAGFNNNANLAIFMAVGPNASNTNINNPIRPVLSTVAANFTGNAQTFTIVHSANTGSSNAMSTPNPYTPAGTVAVSFVDANNNAVANNNAISNNGTPPYLTRRPWFRR